MTALPVIIMGFDEIELELVVLLEQEKTSLQAATTTTLTVRNASLPFMCVSSIHLLASCLQLSLTHRFVAISLAIIYQNPEISNFIYRIGNSSLIFFWRSPLASENCNEYDVSNVEDMRVVFCKSKVERHVINT